VSYFRELVAATEAGAADLAAVPQIREALAGRISRPTYLAYLAQAYHHVRHTVPLMRAARARMDAVHEPFRRALDEYISEETGHEAWILEDIRNAGGDWERVRDGAPAPATQAMVDYAYRCVDEVNPMGLFGMIYVLEATSARLAARGASAVAKRLGLGPECFSYLRSHGALDVEHLRFFQGLMDEVADPRDQAAITRAARAVFALFADVFRALPMDRSVADAV
jgi:pyrroloquinoline quinone (PQQ) biosynthesis protein C